MKKLILSSLIGIILTSSIIPTHALPHKKKIKNSCEVSVIEESKPNVEQTIEINEEGNEDDTLSAIENMKKVYLKIIESLSCRNTLWEQSSNFVKIINKNECANLWATAIKEKNGALLYSISNDNLKSQLKNIFKDNPSWFVEQDKNIIESFTLSKSKKSSNNTYIYQITYKSIHKDGYVQLLKQTISIENTGDSFRVCEFSDITPKKDK